MQYNKVTETQIKTFQQIVGQSFVIILDVEKAEYAQDYTEDLYYMPEVVVKPKTTDEVAAIVKVCYEHNLPITPRGAGTGLSGGALPIYGGVVIAMGRMNQIVDIDERNFQVTVEPGVINENLQQAVKEKGLFYPPDPASKGSCFLGGNIAHASGGPRALKYGTTRDYVLNLEVVLPTGEVIWTGANTLKYSTGYNLTHLFIGSEGTLGIVTKMVLKLIPHPQQTLLMLAPFSSPEKACEAVNGIFIAGGNPSACEFVEPEGFRLSANMLNINFTIDDGVEAYLLIEVDGNNMDTMLAECELISDVLYAHESGEVLFAQMHLNASSAADFLKIPSNAVVELGSKIEI